MDQNEQHRLWSTDDNSELPVQTSRARIYEEMLLLCGVSFPVVGCQTHVVQDVFSANTRFISYTKMIKYVSVRAQKYVDKTSALWRHL